jgi:hypothetical protein
MISGVAYKGVGVSVGDIIVMEEIHHDFFGSIIQSVK